MHLPRVVQILAGAVLLLVFGAGTLLAIDRSQGYRAESELAVGSLVSVDQADSGTAVYAQVGNAGRLAGVVVGDNSATEVVTTGNGQIQVARAGSAMVMVTDMDGVIRSGDKIVPSGIAGVGSRLTRDGRIAGTAQAGFSQTTAGAKSVTVGGRPVWVGSIPVLLEVSDYVQPSTGALTNAVPKVVQDVATAIAGGRPVPIVRVLLSFAVAVVTIIGIIILLSITIHSTIQSLGRNPLAGKVVRRQLVQVGALVVVLLGLGLAASYYLLIW